MAGNIAGESPESLPENELFGRLKELEPSQIQQLFDGFCFDCLSLLKARLAVLTNGNHICESSIVDLSSPPSSRSSTVSSPGSTEKPGSKVSPYSGRQDKNTDNISPSLSPSLVNGKPQLRDLFDSGRTASNGNQRHPITTSNGLSEEEKQRYLQVGRKKNFVHYERVDGKEINVLQGLELHTGVFDAQEQKDIVESVYKFQKMGRKGQLMARTYTEPKKWMRGKGRVTIQFGCCYNYAVDKDGNPPGIVRDEEVDPLPPVFKRMISQMVRWHVLPPTCVPNSCIVNIYDEGDCIPPHIDHHDFLRPFCTVSFLTECNILFGTNLKVSGPGEFSGPVSIPLPVGSVLVLKGNGADVAKHCVPAVPAKRISVTFRRMDNNKIPYSFSPDPELQSLKPVLQSSPAKAGVDVAKTNGKSHNSNERKTVDKTFNLQNDFPPLGLQDNDFPPLGGFKTKRR